MSAERQVTNDPSPLSLAMYCSQIPATFVPRTPCDTTLRLMNASVPDNDPVYSEPFFSLFPCRSTRFSRVSQESAARQWRLGKSSCLCRMSSTTVPTHQGFLVAQRPFHPVGAAVRHVLAWVSTSSCVSHTVLYSKL